jgi:MFS transporter, DHA1 family, inner membrane transport protein
MRYAVLAIALGAFAVGTTEFVVIGLLPTIASDLSIDMAAAGLLVTGYAVGIAVGGPILTFITRRMAKPMVLVGLMVGFAVAHLLLAIAPTFELLLLGRLLTASAHGAFFAVGAIVAAETAEPGHEGRAIGLMFTGLTVATVIGVPLGTFIGQQTSWRAPFLVVAALAAAAAIAIRVLVRTRRASAVDRRPMRVDRPALAFALATTVIGFGSQFVVFTFLAAFLQGETGIALSAISLLLVVFGVASAIGSIAGGRASDRWPRATLPSALAILALILFGFGVLASYPWAVIPLLFLWGIAGFVLSPALQARVVTAAGPGNTLASSLNISAFNVGIATGSFLGTAVVAGGGLSVTPFVAAGLSALAIIPALLGSRRATVSGSAPGLPAAPAAVPVPTE